MEMMEMQPPTESESSRIWVHEFDTASAEAFADQVLTISENDRSEPIVVYIDSPGGYIDGLATMISVMDSVPNPFITIVTGHAMSAGAILFSHGDVRCVGPHARIMIHECSGGLHGNAKDVENEARELARLNRYFGGILARNCGKTFRELEAMYNKRREIYLSPQQAREFGIADHIGIPLLDRHIGFELKFHPKTKKGSK